MTRQQIFTEVKNLIAQEGFIEEDIKESANLRDDIGMDSLDVVETVMAIEERFEMVVPDADAEKLKTVGDVVDYLAETCFK